MAYYFLIRMREQDLPNKLYGFWTRNSENLCIEDVINEVPLYLV